MEIFLNTKINIIFAAMKRSGIILFKLLFLLLVFSCFTTDTFSHYNKEDVNIEISQYCLSSETSCNPDADPVNEDQIDHSDSSYISPEQLIMSQSTDGGKLIFRLYFSVWQPPKIS
jgi:hypothetical protein